MEAGILGRQVHGWFVLGNDSVTISAALLFVGVCSRMIKREEQRFSLIEII